MSQKNKLQNQNNIYDFDVIKNRIINKDFANEILDNITCSICLMICEIPRIFKI